MTPHYISLISSYGIVVGLWFLLNHFVPSLWRYENKIQFKKAYLEFVFALIAVIAILGIGQLYINNLLIPSNGNVFLDAINQFIIFSPTVILILIRKHSVETLWIPISKIAIHGWLVFF